MNKSLKKKWRYGQSFNNKNSNMKYKNIRIQMELKQKIKEFDDFDWSLKLNEPNTLKYVNIIKISILIKNNIRLEGWI